eukprot:TRINITY_DN5342_c0_g1_i1.p1 TRINITY_DN5342_c0_g1~~TRINITY_DN5342_c0_g1_i1.p1  ORF type:complete len:651 (-),score=151.16 TRINITY_DN5342_c0_g1_i1:54-2006(-)
MGQGNSVAKSLSREIAVPSFNEHESCLGESVTSVKTEHQGRSFRRSLSQFLQDNTEEDCSAKYSYLLEKPTCDNNEPEMKSGFIPPSDEFKLDENLNSAEVAEDIQALVQEQKDHLEEVKQEMNDLVKTRATTLKIALLGLSNSGKSSLIKGICLLDKDAEPKVGMRNGLTDKAHVFLVDNAIEFIDLPGIGRDASVDTEIMHYLAQKVDICLVVVAGTISEDLIKMHRTIKSASSMKFFYVITHADSSCPEDLADLEENMRNDFSIDPQDSVFRTFCKNYSAKSKRAPESGGIHDNDQHLCPSIMRYLHSEKHKSLLKSTLWISATGSKAEKLKHCQRIIATSLPAMTAAVWTPYAGGVLSLSILVLSLKRMCVCFKLSDEGYRRLEKIILPGIISRALFALACGASDFVPALYVALNVVECISAFAIGAVTLFSAFLILQSGIALEDAKAIAEIRSKVKAVLGISKLLSLYRETKSFEGMVNQLLDPKNEDFRKLGLDASEYADSLVESVRYEDTACHDCKQDIVGEPTFFVSDCHETSKVCNSCVDKVRLCEDTRHDADEIDVCFRQRCYNDPRKPCYLCQEPDSVYNLVVLQCGHIICRDCATTLFARQLSAQKECPWRHLLRQNQEIHSAVDFKSLHQSSIPSTL